MPTGRPDFIKTGLTLSPRKATFIFRSLLFKSLMNIFLKINYFIIPLFQLYFQFIEDLSNNPINHQTNSIHHHHSPSTTTTQYHIHSSLHVLKARPPPFFSFFHFCLQQQNIVIHQYSLLPVAPTPNLLQPPLQTLHLSTPPIFNHSTLNSYHRQSTSFNPPPSITLLQLPYPLLFYLHSPTFNPLILPSSTHPSSNPPLSIHPHIS